MGGYIFGKSAARVRAEEALIDAEDRLMATIPEEMTNLALHVERQDVRNQVQTMRGRDLKALFAEKSDRNFWTLVAVAAVLVVKGNLTLVDVAHAVLTFLGFH